MSNLSCDQVPREHADFQMEICGSEPPGKAGGYEVIGEGSIAADVRMILFRNFDVGEIFVRVPLERDRAGNRKREVTF